MSADQPVTVDVNAPAVEAMQAIVDYVLAQPDCAMRIVLPLAAGGSITLAVAVLAITRPGGGVTH